MNIFWLQPAKILMTYDDPQIVWHLFLGDLACLVIEKCGVHGDFGIGFLQETRVWQMMILICPLSWENHPKSNIDFGMGGSTIILNAKEAAKNQLLVCI